MKIPWHVSLFSADGFQSLLGFIGKWFKQNMWESNEDLSIPFGIYQARESSKQNEDFKKLSIPFGIYR